MSQQPKRQHGSYCTCKDCQPSWGVNVSQQPKWTAGPWHLNDEQATHGLNLCVVDSHDQIICRIPFGQACDKPNGRLIAAAPEMVEALQQASIQVNDCEPYLTGEELSAMKSRIRAIIAGALRKAGAL